LGRGGAFTKSRDAADDVFHLLGGDQPRAFELPRGVLVARAPKVVLSVCKDSGTGCGAEIEALGPPITGAP
jgi:hypothetical protein